MKCTVVVPVYNSEETICACLEALVGQEGVELNRDYTILLVNDGSTDGTLDIARRFPISILNMPVNSGRLAARLAGARVAMTSPIFFVDSRVVMERDAVAQIEELPNNECFMCVIREPAKHELDWFNRTFHLIRSRYYTVNHEFGGIIDKSNFKRARKGTTAIVIDRDTFIDINGRIGYQRVNDDTLLFYHLVYDLDGKLRVSRKVMGSYWPRRNSNKLMVWLLNRGSVFADFYLISGGFYHKFFITFLLMVCTGIFFAFCGYAGVVFSLFFCLYLGICGFFSREPKDFMILMLVLPMACAVFGAGILRYFWKAFTGSIRIER